MTAHQINRQTIERAMTLLENILQSNTVFKDWRGFLDGCTIVLEPKNGTVTAQHFIELKAFEIGTPLVRMRSTPRPGVYIEFEARELKPFKPSAFDAKSFKLDLAAAVERLNAVRIANGISTDHQWAYFDDDGTASWWKGEDKILGYTRHVVWWHELIAPQSVE